MKNAIIHPSIRLLLLCLFLSCTLGSFAIGGENDKKNKKEKPKELRSDQEFHLPVEDIIFTSAKSIKIYNNSGLLVYEDNVASIEKIKDSFLKQCFIKSEFLMEHMNTKYYLVL